MTEQTGAQVCNDPATPEQVFSGSLHLDGIARQIQVACNRADVVAAHLSAATYLAYGFHAYHSRLLRPKGQILTQPGWSKLNADFPGYLVSFAR